MIILSEFILNLPVSFKLVAISNTVINMAVIALLSVELIVFIDFQVSDHKVAPVGYSKPTSRNTSQHQFSDNF